MSDYRTKAAQSKAAPATQREGGEKNLAVVQQTDMSLVQNPAEVIAVGKAMATQLKSVIKGANLIVKIGQGEHIRFEGWQTVGAFFRATPITEWTEELKTEEGTFFGVKCHVGIYQNGQKIAGADALCTKNEKNWKSKEAYELGSMAQTRAAAKAFRMAFSWIVVLAGYSGTPAEEVVPGSASGKML